ncbi:MAG TPA: 2-dehydropantoate 2-reductase [Allosphingosinicella sp.]|nr:2-dehydropantoate 2-reductase [Allosphingosinicella sp.]
MRDIAIIGAGAMGCLFAARLAGAGANVTLVDVDDARLATLAAEGVTLADDAGEHVARVTACRAEAAPGPADLIILFTKGLHSRAAMQAAAPLIGPATIGLTLQNGLGNGEVMADTVPPARVVHGITDFPADLEGPARVSTHGPGQSRLGGFVPDADDAAARVAELLSAAGLPAVAEPAIEGAIWEKVAFNAALNALGAVTGRANAGIGPPPGRRIAFAIAAETAAVAAAKGVAVDLPTIQTKIDFVFVHHPNHKSSMLQDRLAGRATEIESINGAVQREGERLGVPTPVTATLADLVRLLESPA